MRLFGGKKRRAKAAFRERQSAPEGSEYKGPDDQLFHGSSRDLVGGAALPNSQHRQGRANTQTRKVSRKQGEYDEQLRNDKAYATRDESYAWTKFAHRTADLGGGRGRVYQVEPQEDQKPGAFTNEVVADKFPVKDQLDVKPNHQGTLPIDWRPHVVPQEKLRASNPLLEEYHQRLFRGKAFTASGGASDALANHPPPGYEANMQRFRQRQDQRRAEHRSPASDDSGGYTQGTLF